MLIRVRTKIGMWRVDGLEPTTTIASLRARLEREHHVRQAVGQVFSLDPGGNRPLRETDALGAVGVKHGDMLYWQVKQEDCAAEVGKKIAADGTIVNKSYEEASRDKGFRPGMMSLRSMRMQWTLSDFMALDSQFEFKIKAQKEATCTKVLMEQDAGNNFQSYMRRLEFGQCRMGYLYGSVSESNEVSVEVIYEPPQESSPEKFSLHEDPMREKVDAVAAALKLQKVGWIFAHPPREEGFLFSGNEVITAAVEQLEAAQGVRETPFVTVRVTLTQEGGETVAHIDAFQVSKQCMEMVAEGAVMESDEPGSLAVNPTYTAIVEGKPAPKVDNNFFLVNVPIANRESAVFISKFPRFNRADELPSADAMRRQLSRGGSEGWTFIDMLSDFHLLLFLSDFIGLTDMAAICESVIDRSKPLGEGYVQLIKAYAGID